MKVFSIVLTLFISLSVSAQEISVKSMELLSSDLTARTNPRLDGNDEPCALIKVIIPAVEGMSFEGWVIGNIGYLPGEYQVYVPAGTKKITFRHPDFAPGEIRFTFPIEGRCTYRVVLEVPQGTGGLESVEKGESSSMLKMAQNYENGTGAYNKNIQQALEWYEKAAEAGSIEAQEYLAEVLFEGKNGFQKNDDKALRWNEACAKRGKSSSYLPLAELYSKKNQTENVIIWLRKYCELNNEDISQILRLGKIIGANKAEGFNWIQKASEAGNKEATILCLNAMKAKSLKDAVPFYKRAIADGNIVVTNEYARLLLNGANGIPKDETEGRRLLEIASNTVFNTYSEYKCDDPFIQNYVDSIPYLLSNIKNGDIDAVFKMILIYRILKDDDMLERMRTVARYNMNYINLNKFCQSYDSVLVRKAGLMESRKEICVTPKKYKETETYRYNKEDIKYEQRASNFAFLLEDIVCFPQSITGKEIIESYCYKYSSQGWMMFERISNLSYPSVYGYEKLPFGTIQISEILKLLNFYTKLTKAVIDNVILSSTPEFGFYDHNHYKYGREHDGLPSSDRVTLMIMRWAKYYYDSDCLARMSDVNVLKELHIFDTSVKDQRYSVLRNLDLNYSDEYSYGVYSALNEIIQQRIKTHELGFPSKYTLSKVKDYMKSVSKKKPTFNNRIPYSPWIRRLKEEGYFWTPSVAQ